MNWKFVHLKDVSLTPWRNGGGTTRELLAWPAAQPWRWRASVAEVEQSGAFSSFPGVQRWFAVLSGDGVFLNIDGHLHTLKNNDPPLAFNGAAQTMCQLIGGATQDFNLMVQGGATARMQRVKGDAQLNLNTPKIIAIYASNAGATLQLGTENLELMPHTFAWRAVETRTLLHVQTTDALLMEIDI
jgi:uncharacterized protein